MTNSTIVYYMNHGFTVFYANIRPSTSVIGSLRLIMPSPCGVGRYQLHTSADLGLGSYIGAKDLKAMVYILHIKLSVVRVPDTVNF